MLRSRQSAGDARLCKLRNYSSVSPYLYAYTVREFGQCFFFVVRKLHGGRDEMLKMFIRFDLKGNPCPMRTLTSHTISLIKFSCKADTDFIKLFIFSFFLLAFYCSGTF